VEPDLAPGNELVEEGLGRVAGAPPAAAAARWPGREPLGGPALGLHQLGEDLVDRDVPEMKIGRQLTLGARVRLVALASVAIEATREKAPPGAHGRRPAAGDRRRGDA